MAVACRRNVADKGYMETRSAVHHSLGVFGHTAVQFLDSRILGKIYRIEIARPDTASATHAVFLYDRHLLRGLVELQAVIRTFAHASPAAAALVRIYDRLPVAMLFLFPARDPQPMPIFFIVPPNPVISWPLK